METWGLAIGGCWKIASVLKSPIRALRAKICPAQFGRRPVQVRAESVTVACAASAADVFPDMADAYLKLQKVLLPIWKAAALFVTSGERQDPVCGSFGLPASAE
jgi:hypothetical protein